MITAQDITGLYAIIPTPARPNADRWDAKDTVDTAETSRLIDHLLGDGVSGIIALGTTGECATLSGPDYRTFVDCVISTTRRRVPVFIGATALGTHEIVARLEFAKSRGADGTLLGLPMWQPLTQKMAVDFYASIAEAFSDLAIMIYANTRAFRFDFGTKFWEAVAKAAPTVVSAKASHATELAERLKATKGQINFLPSDMIAEQFFGISPGTTTACWATSASMGPHPARALMEAVRRADAQEVKKISAEIGWANAPIMPLVKDPQIFASYNIQLEKVRIDEAGYCVAGPSRPPYESLPEDYAEAARECGRRSAKLNEQYGRGR
jgi:trans-o-hydroxybenzylidenepyruvate hydratase-aldolase